MSARTKRIPSAAATLLLGTLGASAIAGSCTSPTVVLHVDGGTDAAIGDAGGGSDGAADGATIGWAADILGELPAGFPRPLIPADQPVTRERAELGRRLFYDVRLSLNQTQSCASCHLQNLGFTDGLTTSVGSTGEAHFRNAPTLANVAYRSVLTWANPLQTSLSEQDLVPLFGEHPVELGMSGHEADLLQRLRDDALYPALFADAFPTEADPISLHSTVVAIAAFERTILSYRSPYDRYVYGGETNAISDSAKRGVALFFDERFECFHCHAGHDFSDSTMTSLTITPEFTFHNTALYNVDGYGAYPVHDRGVMDITTLGADMGRFRVPTLRNLGLSAPYFHDGSAATLDDVLDHYARGGRLIASGPNAGDGRTSPFRSEFVMGFTPTLQEREDLKAFLLSLTDVAMTTDPRLSDPFAAP